MTIRAATLLPCLLIAGLAWLATSGTPVRADDCAAAPGREAASGEHWYYRIDRATKRHCWYLRAEGKTTRTASAVVPTTQPAIPASTDTLDQSVANARAELPAVADAADANLTVMPARPVTVAQSPTPASTPAPAPTQPWTMAERWSNQGGGNASATAVEPVALTARLQSAKTVERGAHPVWMLISTIAGALTLAGLTVALISNFRRRPSLDRAADEVPHASRWEPHDWQPHHDDPVDDATAGQMIRTAEVHTSDLPPMNWIRIAREEAQKRGEQIEELLSASQRRPAI